MVSDPEGLTPPPYAGRCSDRLNPLNKQAPGFLPAVPISPKLRVNLRLICGHLGGRSPRFGGLSIMAVTYDSRHLRNGGRSSAWTVANAADRARAFSAARRHSVFVRFLRLALPLTAGVLLVVYL